MNYKNGNRDHFCKVTDLNFNVINVLLLKTCLTLENYFYYIYLATFNSYNILNFIILYIKYQYSMRGFSLYI